MLQTKFYASITAPAVFLISLLLFTYGLSPQEFIAFETRFALFAQEMLHYGPSFFPTSYHQPYPDYPVTATLLTYFLAHAFGHFSKLVAVFPSALAAALTMTATYAIGALRDRRWGLYATLFLLMTVTFLAEARTISLDQYTTMVTAWCFYCAYSAQQQQKYFRLWFIPVLFVIGFAFRGPIGLIIPAAVLYIFYILENDYKKSFLIIGYTLSLLILCSLGLFLIAYHVGGLNFGQEVLRFEIFYRMQDSGNNPPFFYYFIHSITSYALTFPLAILILLGLRRTCFAHNAAPNLQLIQKLAAWFLIIMIGMSIPGDKKIRYILPIAPALALISAYLFIMARDKQYFTNLYKYLYKFFYFTPALAILATLSLWLFSTWKSLDFSINYFTALSIFAVFALLNFSNSMWLKNKLTKECWVLLLAALSFVAFYIFLLEPVNLSINSTRAAVQKIEALRQAAGATLVFYQEDRDSLPIKYLVNVQPVAIPQFVTQPDQLLTIKNKAFFVAGETEFSQIPFNELKHFQVITHAVIGRKKMIVFTQAIPSLN